jgi:hypothetical protein
VRAHIQSHSLWQVQQHQLVWYDRYDCMREMRDALQMLENFLAAFGMPYRPSDAL